MFKEIKPGLYQSELLSKKDIIHGFSSRTHGDMRLVEPRLGLKQMLGLSAYRLVAAEQVHGASVHVVTREDFGKTVPGVDGLVFRQSGSKTYVALGIVSADCVPILFADSQAGVIGVAHAGWKGTRDGIVEHVVRSMLSLGAQRDAIRVALGPSIGSCCYDVPEKRAKQFNDRSGVVTKKNMKFYLDLAKANRVSLIEIGIPAEYIDQSPLCTYHNSDILYSFRKDSKETYGEQMAMIASSQDE